jgi:hypothetical protein
MIQTRLGVCGSQFYRVGGVEREGGVGVGVVVITGLGEGRSRDEAKFDGGWMGMGCW